MPSTARVPINQVERRRTAASARPMVEAARGPVIALLLSCVIWEVVARSGLFPPSLMPTTAEIGTALYASLISGDTWIQVAASAWRLAVGMGIAAVAGILLGLLMGTHRTVDHFASPLVQFFLPIPALAWIPLFMLWFGLGNASIIPLVVLAALLPIAVNTHGGVKSVNRTLLRAAQAMSITGPRRLVNVVFPASLTSIIVGVRLGFAQAWRAVIAGELVAAGGAGLGVTIFEAKRFVNTSEMIAALIIIMLMSLAVEYGVIANLENRTVVKWGMQRKAKQR